MASSQSSANSARNKQQARIVAQTKADAKLQEEFDEQGTTFDYSRTVSVGTSANLKHHPPRNVAAYLNQIQKLKLIQPFGCLLALNEKTLRVIAYSENAPDWLTATSHEVPSGGAASAASLRMGTDLRHIFTSSSYAALLKAFAAPDVSLLNPVLVHCKTSGKPLYAILHRVTGSLVIDFEPVKPYDAPSTAAGALQSYKLAAKAISRLQSVPSGNLERLLNAAVQEVFELTGYDRVMVYKFHEDEHGEVIAEVTVPGLDSYQGLHYPATDLPQAARFLFMKNKVRMICDCRAKPVKILQGENLEIDLTLCGSTLRAPHSCHLQYMENMGSIASLVMAVVVNEEGEEEEEGSANSQQPRRKMLWGLLVCHHTTPRFVPFPLRYACEFIAQVFAIHVSKELLLEDQRREKDILRTQSLLARMLLRDAPTSIINQSPNVMDLVKCDGAALLYRDKVWRLGLAPSESQVRELAQWLEQYHHDSSGFTTDSLHESRFRGLGDAVCGMAAVKITAGDVLFWFRSSTTGEIAWGGAKHDPSDVDDARRMHPRSSFCAFLEVVKARSSPWKDYEVAAVHSLQLILRGSIQREVKDEMTNVIHTRLHDLTIDEMAELQVVTNEMVRLIETAPVPILSVDVDGLVNGWNAKIAESTGLPVSEALGKHLLTLVEDSSVDTIQKMLASAVIGEEEHNIEFQMQTFASQVDSGPLYLMANACSTRDFCGKVVGVCFIAQDLSSHKKAEDKFTRIEGDYMSIIHSPIPLIPPLFGTDESGWCTEWNSAMTKLTGWTREQVLRKLLLGEVFGTRSACCRLKTQEAFVTLGVVLNNAIMGGETEKTPFGFFNRDGAYVDCLLSAIKKGDGKGTVTGVVCFLQLASHQLQEALRIQKIAEQTALKRSKNLAYLRTEIKTPLSGIIFLNKLLERTEMCIEQQKFLRTSVRCQHQLAKVLSDLDIDKILDGSTEIESVRFALQDVINTAVAQVMLASEAKAVKIIHNSEQTKESFYGDSLRLQQAFANFLLVCVRFTPSGGQIKITLDLEKDGLGNCVQLVSLKVRIAHSGEGIPEQVRSQMLWGEEEVTEEGMSLLVSRKLVMLMNGSVQYQRGEGETWVFTISLELPSVHHFGQVLPSS